jgi:ABC-type branched-subunit amino acid transport system substrate-binding protein
MQKFYPEIDEDPVSFEGFLSAKLFVEAMKKNGVNPDRENLIRILEEMNDTDIGIGENINFGRLDHQGLDRVYITTIENGKIIYLQD